MSYLIQALVSRDGLTYLEAQEIIEEWRSRVSDGEDPEELLFDEGFEPDYIFDLL